MDIRTDFDPRDQTAELDEPAYRVYFWAGTSHCYEHEITGADVHEVIKWAESYADGRAYSLWVCAPDHTIEPPGLLMVRLAGWDPPAGDESRPAHAITVP